MYKNRNFSIEFMLDKRLICRSSRAALPTLSEVTFRPHSALLILVPAVIRDSCAERREPIFGAVGFHVVIK
jgi:hypothetical protein